MSQSSPLKIKVIPSSCRSNKANPFSGQNKSAPSKVACTPCSQKQNCYEKTCCGHITRAHYQTFLTEIHNEIKKIDPTISLSFDEKTIFSKVLSVVHQSVEYILLVQEKFTNMDWIDLENFKSNLRIKESKMINEAEKLRITSKHLEQYDLLLRSKEEQIKNDEKALKAKMELIQQEDLYTEELKLRCIQLEQEIRLLKKIKPTRNEVNETRLLKEIDELKEQNLKLKQIMTSPEVYKPLIEEHSYDKLALDKEKAKLEQVKLDVLELKTSIEKEKEKIKSQSHENSRASIHEFDVNENSINLSELSCGVTEKQPNLEVREKELECKEAMLNQIEKETNEFIMQIRKQIEEYSTEFDIRESSLIRICQKNEAKERDLERKIIEFKLIEDGLQASKQEIEDLNSFMLPSFEEHSQALSNLLADLYSKKQDLIENCEKVKNLIETLENQEICMKEEEETRKREHEVLMNSLKGREEHNKEIEDKLAEKENSLSNRLNEDITKIGKELEEKLKEVRKKEQEIDSIKHNLEEEKAENEKVAMMLKVTHFELENNKIKMLEKIRIKKEKLKEMKAKLEEHLKFIQMKDQEKSPRSRV